MKSLFKYFHWYYGKQKKHVLFNLSLGLLYWAYQVVALPFGIEATTWISFFTAIFILFPFILVWPLISYGADALITLFYRSAKTKSKHEFWWVLFKLFAFIHLMVFIQGILCMWTCMSWNWYLKIIAESLLLFSLVFIPFAIIGKGRFHKQRELLNPTDMSSLFEFKGQLKKSIKLDLSEICHIKSDDKYVEFYLLHVNNPVERVLFRASLKSIMEQLKNEENFIQIHRSFLINTDYLVLYHEDHQVQVGIETHMTTLPVSKSFRKNLPQIKI